MPARTEPRPPDDPFVTFREGEPPCEPSANAGSDGASPSRRPLRDIPADVTPPLESMPDSSQARAQHSQGIACLTEGRIDIRAQPVDGESTSRTFSRFFTHWRVMASRFSAIEADDLPSDDDLIIINTCT
jgi:hypothetical protein